MLNIDPEARAEIVRLVSQVLSTSALLEHLELASLIQRGEKEQAETLISSLKESQVEGLKTCIMSLSEDLFAYDTENAIFKKIAGLRRLENLNLAGNSFDTDKTEMLLRQILSEGFAPELKYLNVADSLTFGADDPLDLLAKAVESMPQLQFVNIDWSKRGETRIKLDVQRSLEKDRSIVGIIDA